MGSYAGEELLHPGESGGGICRCLAADESILRGGGCEGEGGEGGSEGQGGKGELHFEDVGLWLELKVFLLRVVGLGDAEMSADELGYRCGPRQVLYRHSPMRPNVVIPSTMYMIILHEP